MKSHMCSTKHEEPWSRFFLPINSSHELALPCMPLHHLLATNPKSRLFWNNRGITSHMGMPQQQKSMKYHLSTILPPNSNPDRTLNRNSMSSRRIKSSSTICIDLLDSKVVTFETSHWLRFPLKTEAISNTVRRKEGRFYSVNAHSHRGPYTIRQSPFPSNSLPPSSLPPALLTCDASSHLLPTYFSTYPSPPFSRVHLPRSEGHTVVEVIQGKLHTNPPLSTICIDLLPLYRQHITSL